MSSVVPKFGPGPVTYEVAEAIKGGQVVEARDEGKIGVAAAGSTTVLGVAAKDAAPSVNAEGTTGTGFPVVDVSAVYVTPYTAVWSSPNHVPVVFSAACGFGEAVIAAADGQVAPAGAAADPATVIGHCTEPGGVAAGGRTGLVKFSR